jgi:DNA-binding NtrC family response regulator
MLDKQKPLVMLIDPDPRTSAFLFPLLAAEGYRSASCSTIARSLSAIQRQHPDLVVVSKEMENCDGMILIGRIKEMSPDTRTILLVEAGDWPSLLDATDAGADDLQRKHFGSVKLLLSVLRLLDPVQDQQAARCLEMRAH